MAASAGGSFVPSISSEQAGALPHPQGAPAPEMLRSGSVGSWQVSCSSAAFAAKPRRIQSGTRPPTEES